MFKKAFFYLIMIGLIAVAVEALSFLANFVLDPEVLYDHRQLTMSKVNQEDLSDFLANRADLELGWNQFGPKVLVSKNCTGVEVEASYNAAGARTYPGYAEDRATIITVGDSYTNGSEAGDEAAYPARLAVRLGTPVANHGVGGFGPVQSFLDLKRNIHRYPQARAVVLGIMYGDVYRMMNSYRPVLIKGSAMLYGLKPYMAGGDIRPHPGRRVLEHIDAFRDHAKRAFDNDYWAKPEFRFPYSLSLLRALKSNYFYHMTFEKKWQKFGIPEYFLAFRSDDILAELFALLDQYAEFARQKGLKPVVIFIPRNGKDTVSAAQMIDANRKRFPPGLSVGDVGSAAIDWDKFNLVSADDGEPCHPSAYGYQKIAEYVAYLLGRDARSP